MKQKVFSILALLLMAATGAWAQTKTLAEATTSDHGKVVCAAGHLHDAKTAVPAGCTAVGILGKVTETGHGLILALQDATAKDWNTINDWTSVTTYASTTLKVLPDDDARGTNLTSYTTLGETAVSNWAVAQKSDYEAIFTNLGSTTNDKTYDDNVNAYITTNVGGTALSDNDNYWSATMYDDDEAWIFNNHNWTVFVKTNSLSVRPVLGFGGEVAPAATGYSVTLAEGTDDATNWKAKVGNGELKALPLTGLTGDGTETVTITYNGTKRVKSVTAVKVDPSVIGVRTFSELKTALSAGKDVKLMNDIECTAEIEITSGPLTIDGNGKKLSPNSEIRAFKVEYSATVAFKNLTLTGFVSEGGPAINNSGTIVLDGCTISNCHVNIDYSSDGGGAIENKSSGKLYAINTTFSGNYSGEIGGAINNYRGSLYMSGCTFTNNYTTESDAYYGGAIGINGGDEVRLINCAFSGNKYGTNTGTNDIGVFNKPENYTIAGCKGATIASDAGDITTNATGTATLDYSDLSNISFTYTPGTNLATITANYEAQDGETLYGKLGSNVKISIADGAKVTLKDVTINGVNSTDYKWAGITCEGDAIITLEGTNTLKGFHKHYPGIYVPREKTLTIEGEGSLNASSDDASGIGAGYGYDNSCGNIVINGGNITATAKVNDENRSAGIGGGNGGHAGNITINGGTVTATGTESAAGIGGGKDADVGNITITGGTVTATGGLKGAGIGGSNQRGFGDILISGGTVNAKGGTEAAGIGGGRRNGFNGSCGSITIKSTVTQVTATKGSGAPNSIGGGYNAKATISVTIETGANVTQN